jgi:hypothetical protein
MQDLWLFLHVLSAIVAFGVLFAQPMVVRSADGAGDAFAKVGMYVQAPALLILIATGIATMYSIGYSFADPWVSVAFTVWILMAAVLFFLVRALRTGSSSVQPLTGAMHLLLVVALWAMIWQPGLGTGG